MRDRSRNRGDIGRNDHGVSNGIVVKLNEKGFGFIEPSKGGKNIFFHSSSMQDKRTFDQLREGDRVSFEQSWDDKAGKEKAINVIFL